LKEVYSRKIKVGREIWNFDIIVLFERAERAEKKAPLFKEGLGHGWRVLKQRPHKANIVGTLFNNLLNTIKTMMTKNINSNISHERIISRSVPALHHPLILIKSYIFNVMKTF